MSYSSLARAAANQARLVTGVDARGVLSSKRESADVAWTRQCAMYIYWEGTGRPSFTKLGTVFGRDRTTVRHAIQKVRAREDTAFQKKLQGAVTLFRLAPDNDRSAATSIPC